MLTKEEKEELNYEKLSVNLRLKIDAAFGSPYIGPLITIWKQKTAYEQEIGKKPLTIRNDSSADLKVLKWLEEATESIINLQGKLNAEEKSQADSIMSGTAEEVKKRVRDKHGLS